MPKLGTSIFRIPSWISSSGHLVLMCLFTGLNLACLALAPCAVARLRCWNAPSSSFTWLSFLLTSSSFLVLTKLTSFNPDLLTISCVQIQQHCDNLNLDFSHLPSIMSKRSVFTTVTALPAGISRQTVLETLHNHVEMIDLNPLVTERHPCKPPPNASPEEFHCAWYEITDKVHYLPGGLYSGAVKFNACFHDLTNGLQTHIFAPMGLNIKGKWTLGGSLPGEPREPVELGVGVPKTGLWLREDVDLRCNVLFTSFVKKTTKKAHGTLVQRMVEKAHLSEAADHNASLAHRNSTYHGSQTESFCDAQSVRSSSPFQSPRQTYQSFSSSGSQRHPETDRRSHGTNYSNPEPSPFYPDADPAYKVASQAHMSVELPSHSPPYPTETAVHPPPMELEAPYQPPRSHQTSPFPKPLFS